MSVLPILLSKRLHTLYCSFSPLTVCLGTTASVYITRLSPFCGGVEFSWEDVSSFVLLVPYWCTSDLSFIFFYITNSAPVNNLMYSCFIFLLLSLRMLGQKVNACVVFLNIAKFLSISSCTILNSHQQCLRMACFSSLINSLCFQTLGFLSSW